MFHLVKVGYQVLHKRDQAPYLVVTSRGGPLNPQIVIQLPQLSYAVFHCDSAHTFPLLQILKILNFSGKKAA